MHPRSSTTAIWSTYRRSSSGVSQPWHPFYANFILLGRGFIGLDIGHSPFTVRLTALRRPFILIDRTLALSVLDWVTFRRSITFCGHIGTDLSTEVGCSTIIRITVELDIHPTFNFGTDLGTRVGTSLRIPAGFRVIDTLAITSAFCPFDTLGTGCSSVDPSSFTIVRSTLLHTGDINFAIMF
ncbi:hypothetical protein CF326_g6501 [Tilletia indica]|nr:hypothetical protein CF326_g6501 [Tilletia indica]